MKKMLSKMQYMSTIESASITRKFGVLFFAAAILPLLLLFYIFIVNSGKEYITVSSSDLGFTMFFATIGILTSFIGMRSALRKIQTVQSLSMPQDKTKDTREFNEIDALANSLADIQKQLDTNIKKLEEIKKTH